MLNFQDDKSKELIGSFFLPLILSNIVYKQWSNRSSQRVGHFTMEQVQAPIWI